MRGEGLEVRGEGWRVRGLRFRVWVLGFRVQSLGFRNQERVGDVGGGNRVVVEYLMGQALQVGCTRNYWVCTAHNTSRRRRRGIRHQGRVGDVLGGGQVVVARAVAVVDSISPGAGGLRRVEEG